MEITQKLLQSILLFFLYYKFITNADDIFYPKNQSFNWFTLIFFYDFPLKTHWKFTLISIINFDPQEALTPALCIIAIWCFSIWPWSFSFISICCYPVITILSSTSESVASTRLDSGLKMNISGENSLMFFS